MQPKESSDQPLPEGVSWYQLPCYGDERGGLVVGEGGLSVPFEIRRVYTIFNTKSETVRGCHAHPGMKQLIVNVTGSFDLILDDGTTRSRLKLYEPGQAVFLDGTVWRELENFSEDCVINCFADQLYEDCVYVRDYAEFIDSVKRVGGES